VELIGQAMHPSHLKTNFSFSQRNGLLQHMKVGVWIIDITLVYVELCIVTVWSTTVVFFGFEASFSAS